MSTGIAIGANPVIRNVGLVSRESQLAIPVSGVVDGSDVAADGVVLRGTILVYNGTSKKYHAMVHGTDTLAKNGFLILQNDLKVFASTDAPFSGYREGFFLISDLLDANSAGSVVVGDLTTTAGFYQLNPLPGGSATELRLVP